MARVIGIDVSKMRLNVYSLEDGRRLAVDNDAAGIAALADQLGLGPRDLVVMEASGGYEGWPHRLLSERGLRVAIVNAARVRDFARASGRLAKTDRVDAEVIARYGAFARPAPTRLGDRRAPHARRAPGLSPPAHGRDHRAQPAARPSRHPGPAPARRGGRGAVRAPLYMAALVASRSNPTLRATYQRLINPGKPPKLALVVLMPKMLITLNAMIRSATPWRQLPAPA